MTGICSPQRHVSWGDLQSADADDGDQGKDQDDKEYPSWPIFFSARRRVPTQGFGSGWQEERIFFHIG